MISSALQEKDFVGFYSFSRLLPAIVIGDYILLLTYFVIGIAHGWLDPALWESVGPFFKWGTSSFLSLIPLVYKYKNGRK